MPNSSSAKKRMRSDFTRQIRNQATLSKIKTMNKKLLKLAGDPAKASEYARLLVSSYDNAVSRGILPEGRADRRKSRIASFLTRIKK